MSDHPSDTVIDLYEENAEAWASLRRNDLFEQPWLDRFLELLPPTDRTVLDLGCGSGRPLAAHFIAKGCRVTGIDGAPALIDIASRAFPAHTWITADMRRLRILGRFHGLIAWHSLFHLTPEAQRPLFATFGQLAHPGAALLFTSGTALGSRIGTFAEQPLYHGSLDTAEYRQLLQDNGFDIVAHVQDDPSCGQATVWLARKKA